MMEDSGSLDDLKVFKKASVIIPTRIIKNDKIIDYLINLKNNGVKKDDFNDLSKEEKIFINEKLKIEENLLKLNSNLNNIVQKTTFIENSCGGFYFDSVIKEPKEEIDLIFNKIRVMNKFESNLSRSIDQLINEYIDEKRKVSYLIINGSLNEIIEETKKDIESLYIIVFPEGGTFKCEVQHLTNFFEKPQVG